MNNDEVKKLRRLLENNNDFGDLERALGNLDQEIADLENVLGESQKPVSAGANLRDIHRNFVGKCCGPILRGYIVGRDASSLFLSTIPGGPVESKVPIRSIIDIKKSKGGSICIDPN